MVVLIHTGFSNKFSMKINSRSPRLYLFLATVATTTLTSCNRGTGCPTNFSLNDIFDACVSVAVNIF